MSETVFTLSTTPNASLLLHLLPHLGEFDIDYLGQLMLSVVGDSDAGITALDL
jgi:hypothetical protein